MLKIDCYIILAPTDGNPRRFVVRFGSSLMPSKGSDELMTVWALPEMTDKQVVRQARLCVDEMVKKLNVDAEVAFHDEQEGNDGQRHK